MRVGIKNKSLDINDINSKLDEMLKDEPCKRESIIAAINEAREQKNAARDRMESTTDDKEFTSAAKDMEEAEKRETLKKDC
jgi:low affinity Fe/Cu permease